MNSNIAIAAFAGTGVEFLEIAAIAYALGRSGYPREAIAGTSAGVIFTIVLALFAWPLFRLVPLDLFQWAVGVMLLGLGLYWVVKSIRRLRRNRRAGWIQDPLRPYEGILEPASAQFSVFNTIVMAKSAAMEGLEICMVISALAIASGAWISAIAGVVVAIAATFGAVFLLHGKLRRVPEVAMKFWTGVLLAGIGAFWIHEGLGRWLRS